MLKSNLKYKKVENLEKICYNQKRMREKGGTNMKMNYLRKIILLIMIFMFVLVSFETTSFAKQVMYNDGGGGKASGGINPDSYKVTLGYNDATYIFNKGGQVLKILRNIAAIAAVVTISIIGVRYMVGSVEQRAEYKQTMMPVVVGCILVGGLAGILTIIQSIFS